MAAIPFPDGFDEIKDLPKTKKILVNCYKDQNGNLLGRPGITQLNTTGGVSRGQFEWNDFLYEVVSTRLIKITDVETGAFSEIGEILGSAPIQTAVGFSDAVIVVPGGAIYTLDKFDSLDLISGNANFEPCVSVTHKDSRFVYCPSSGDPVFFSNVNDAGTVEPDSFFDAEQLPDRNNQVFTLKNILYIMGTDSIELFQNRNVLPVPFIRSDAGAMDTGFIGGLLEYRETFVFIGRDKNQDFGIYSIGSGTAPKISNKAIDTILATYTINELSEVVASRFKFQGDDFATFTLRRDSFAFINGKWFILESLDEGTSEPWGGGFITEFQGRYYTSFEDMIGRIDDINTDYGESITRSLQFGVRQPERRWFTMQSASIGISQGFNTGKVVSGETIYGSVGIQVSRDNVLFSEPFFRSVSAIGEYSQILDWNYPGGMGVYEGFMAVRIFTTDNLKFSSDHLWMDGKGQLELA